jgi:phage FluMu protein gp41
MTNEELLQELLNAQKKALLYARIALGLVLCVIIAAACAAPYAIKAVQRAQASLRTIDAISGSVSAFVGDGGGASVAETLEKLNGIDYARLNEAMAKLDGMDLGQLNDAISRLNNVDFNRLNSAMNSLDNVDFTRLDEAIRDLDSLMEPLNRFVKALSPA